MKRYALLAILLLAGCPKKDVTLYRSASQGNAMQTCDANQRFRAEAVGADAEAAKAKAEAEVKSVIASKQGCAALIWNEGSGKKLDGTWAHVADYQFCKCP